MRIHIIPTLLFMLLIAGCSSSTGSNEAEHLEHHIPPHQPGSYGETVDQLKLRFHNIVSSTESSEVSLKELEDIITWLPDLAGDSELKKQEWDTVVQIQRELLNQFKLLRQESKNSTAKNKIDECMAKLEAFKKIAMPTNHKHNHAAHADNSHENKVESNPPVNPASTN